MSLNRLSKLIPPPEVPTYVPTEADWEILAKRLGTNLPDSVKELCSVYGMGTFRGNQATAISIHCPGYRGGVDDFINEYDRLKEVRGTHISNEQPFNVFPEENGILPLGLDETDVWLCWKTTEKVNDWEIVVRWTFGPNGLKTFNMGLCEFLVALFERKITLPCWPPPHFTDSVHFAPFTAAL